MFTGNTYHRPTTMSKPRGRQSFCACKRDVGCRMAGHPPMSAQLLVVCGEMWKARIVNQVYGILFPFRRFPWYHCFALDGVVRRRRQHQHHSRVASSSSSLLCTHNYKHGAPTTQQHPTNFPFVTVHCSFSAAPFLTLMLLEVISYNSLIYQWRILLLLFQGVYSLWVAVPESYFVSSSTTKIF